MLDWGLSAGTTTPMSFGPNSADRYHSLASVPPACAHSKGLNPMELFKHPLSSTLSNSRRITGHLTEAGKERERDLHYALFGTGGEEIHRMPELLADDRDRIRECG
jgi:hypothetical protein